MVFCCRFARTILVFLFFCTLLQAEESDEYRFVGRHFLASYYDCDEEALANVENLHKAMERAITASKAHILEASEHRFDPTGVTMLFLLSESHASIHTYPEHRACFVDIFTCGSTCQPENFHAILMEYLQPGAVSEQLFDRN